MREIKRLAAVTSSLILGFGVVAVPLPAQAAGLGYQVCNSGNSVSIVRAYDINWPYEERFVLPGSSNCRWMTDGYGGQVGGIRLDPDWSDVDNSNYDDVKRWRIRPGDSNTYGPWHCGESIIDPPNSWQTQGGIDIETSGSNGTTC